MLFASKLLSLIVTSLNRPGSFCDELPNWLERPWSLPSIVLSVIARSAILPFRRRPMSWRAASMPSSVQPEADTVFGTSTP